MDPIKHKPTRHLSIISVLSVATFAGVVALATMIATGGGRDRALEARWYGLLASGNPQILSTFRTQNLTVDSSATIGALSPTTTTLQWGAIPPPSSNAGWFQPQNPQMTTQLWMQEDDTGHTGSNGNNEAINLVLRDNVGFALGAGGTATAGSLDVAVGPSVTSGTGDLSSIAIVSSATGCSGAGTCEAFLAPHGTMRVVDDGNSFGSSTLRGITDTSTLTVTGGGLVNLGLNVGSFEVGSGVGGSAIVGIGNYNTGKPLSIKNTTSGTSGIDISADTSLNANESGAITFYRGTGNGTEFAGFALVGNAGSFAVDSKVLDTVIYNYDAANAGHRICLATGSGPNCYFTVTDWGSTTAGSGAAQTSGNTLTLLGNGQQLTLQGPGSNSGGGSGVSAEFRLANSGNLIWDLSPVPSVNTDSQTVRFFRRTNTSGAVGIQIDTPNTATAISFLSATGTLTSGLTYFTNPVQFGGNSGAVKYPVTVIQNSGTGQTSSNRIASFDTGGSLVYSFDTTSAAITSYGIYAQNNAGRSAGANSLTNIGVYANSLSGQVNYSLVADSGDIVVKDHRLGNGAAPTVTSCGSGFTQVGDDKSGTVTEGTGATGCTITFATAFTNIVPSCTVSSQAGLVFTYTESLSALTIVNVGALSSTSLDYHCDGHRTPGAI